MKSRLFVSVLFVPMLAVLVGCATASSVHTSGGKKVFTFRRDYSNTHLVETGPQTYVMIDSGSYEQAPGLIADILKAGIDPRWIKGIILTHGHWDHAGGATFFQEKFSTPVFAGSGDREIFENGKSDKLCPTGLMAQIRKSGDEEKEFRPPTITRWIAETGVLAEVPGVVVASVPSHTHGSLAILAGKNIFVGDLFRGSVVGSAPATHFYICDEVANRRAINALLTAEAKEGRTFFVGHFGPAFDREKVLETFSEP